jgi:hypothetical protein
MQSVQAKLKLQGCFEEMVGHRGKNTIALKSALALAWIAYVTRL